MDLEIASTLRLITLFNSIGGWMVVCIQGHFLVAQDSDLIRIGIINQERIVQSQEIVTASGEHSLATLHCSPIEARLDTTA